MTMQLVKPSTKSPVCLALATPVGRFSEPPREATLLFSLA